MTKLAEKPLRHLMMAVLTTATAGLTGHVHAGDPERGAALAERWCASCHVVADDIAGGTLGPAFSGIVPLRDRSGAQLKVWLAAPHDPMPDFGLSAREIDDIVAYIISLNPAQ